MFITAAQHFKGDVNHAISKVQALCIPRQAGSLKHTLRLLFKFSNCGINNALTIIIMKKVVQKYTCADEHSTVCGSVKVVNSVVSIKKHLRFISSLTDVSESV